MLSQEWQRRYPRLMERFGQVVLWPLNAEFDVGWQGDGGAGEMGK